MVPPDDRTPADAHDDLAAGYETESRQPVFPCVRAVAP